MANVFIEPLPKGSDDPITGYVIEYENGKKHSGPYGNQGASIAAAKTDGHHPLVARVRHTDKGKLDQWRSAS